LLLIALAWLVLSLSFLGWGRLLASTFGPPESREDFSMAGYLFLGLSVCGLLTAMAWILLPVGPVFGGLLTGTGAGYALAFYRPRQAIRLGNPVFALAILGFVLVYLAKAAAPGSYYDCGLYYIQTMRWVQQFPAVPGLANLHIRFGNASAWHMLCAAFNWPGLFRGSFDDLGELMLIWFLFFHGRNTLILKGFERFLSLGLVVFAVWQTRHLLSAPAPDLAAGILGLQTLWQFRKFLRLWNPLRPNQLNTRGLALFVQSLFLAQIKLSAIPFLAIAAVVVFLVLREGWWLRAGQLVFLGLLVGFTMCLRSYLLSGYLLFPVFNGGLQPDWTVARSAVTDYLDGVRGFARHMLTPQELRSGLTYESYGRLSFSRWFPVWLAERSLSDWFCLIPGLGGWLLLIRYASGQVRRSFFSHWPVIFFTWLCGMMLLFWFSNAPDIRFGLAILGTGFSYALASLLLLLFGRPGDEFPWQVHMPRLLLVMALSSLVWLRDARAFRSHLIFPAPYPQAAIQTYRNHEGKILYTPQNNTGNPLIDADQCWDSPLPCSQNPVPGIEFRGNSPAEGFRIRQSPGSPE
jgi:hypothetical protein